MNTLQEIQAKLKAPKDKNNTFGKYKYRSCESILEAVKPLLDGSLLTLSDELVQIGERYYIKATASFNDGKSQVSVTAFAREAHEKKGMDESQITGTSSSYARKYALNGLFLIDDTKDADTNEYHNQTENPFEEEPSTDDLISPVMADRIDKIIRLDRTKEQAREVAVQLYNKFDVTSVKLLTNGQYKPVLDWLEEQKGGK